MYTQRSRNSDLGKRFPALETLASSYVNIEWDEFASPEAAVLAFRRDFPAKAPEAAAGVRAVLEEFEAEPDRYAALDAIGWGFSGPPGVLDSFLAWTRDALTVHEHDSPSDDSARAV
jgi:hypothetical protein